VNYTDRDRTLALAGVFQAAALVKQAAHTGSVDSQAQLQSLQSIFAIESVDVASVYGGEVGVSLGLKTLLSQLQGKRQRDMEISRYAIMLLHLERKLWRRPALMSEIRAGIARGAEQTMHFPLDHSTILASMADLYVRTVSTLQPKVHVLGEREHLTNTENTNRIRALLLAGIRSAVLWHQAQGSRLRLLLQPNRFIEHATHINRGIARQRVAAINSDGE
jgi:high frequency lysogenization protein